MANKTLGAILIIVLILGLALLILFLVLRTTPIYPPTTETVKGEEETVKPAVEEQVSGCKIIVDERPINISDGSVNLQEPGSYFEVITNPDKTFYLANSGLQLKVDSSGPQMTTSGSKFARFKNGMIFNVDNGQFVQIYNNNLITSPIPGSYVTFYEDCH